MTTKLSLDPFESCESDKFAGRYDETRKIRNLLKPDDRKKALMLSGLHGIGKTSLLRWAEHEIATNELNMKIFKNAFKEHSYDDDDQRFRVYFEMMKSFESDSFFGWIKTNFNSARARNIAKLAGEIITILIGFFAPPYKVAADFAKSIIEKTPDYENPKYSKLLSKLSELMEGLSEVMVRNGTLCVILLDDVQNADIEEIYILNYLLETIPAGIALIIAFDFEQQELSLSGNPSLVEDSYVFLKKKLAEGSIVCMKGMEPDDVKRFVEKRYNWFNVGDPSDKNSIANILSSELGTPENLVAFFEDLNHRNLKALNSNSSEFREILNRSKSPAKRRYDNLSKKWQSRVNILCVLPPNALVYPLLDCMMKGGNLGELLSDELNRSPLFIEIEKDRYVFSDHSLRNYARDKLHEYDLQKLSSNMDRCIKENKVWLERHAPLLSKSVSAESRFIAGDYISALRMNQDLVRSFRERNRLGLALGALERSIICAERLDDRRSLAEIYDEMGQVLTDCSVLNKSNLSKSIGAYQQSLKIAEDIGYTQMKTVALDHMDRTLKEMNNPAEAALYFEKAKTIAQIHGYKENEMEMTMEMGNLMRRRMHDPSVVSNYVESRYKDMAACAMDKYLPFCNKPLIGCNIEQPKEFLPSSAINKASSFQDPAVDAVEKNIFLFKTSRSQINLAGWYLSMLLHEEAWGRLGFLGYDLQGNPNELRGANYPNYAMNVVHQGEYAGISSATHASRMDAFACNPLIKVTFANPGLVFDWADNRAAFERRKAREFLDTINTTGLCHD